MAAPSKVEFPGKKKQRVKMRGTKQANEATSKKLAKQLKQFQENPRGHLPAMTFEGRMRWGRTDPVTKTLRDLERIIKKKDDVKWLSKRMMAKRGDPVSKAFAGSLHATHDEQFTMVGQFKSSSFGSASYIRRGDGKPGYLAGIQNYSHLTLRMLPWEEHAKRGMYFFSWDGGFVCTGPKPKPPEAWLGDVLSRSRFDLEKSRSDDNVVWATEDVDQALATQGHPTKAGYVKIKFHHGPEVYLGFEAIASFTKKDAPFIHHLALSMLPPLLPSILTVEAHWAPKGWPTETPLPEPCIEGIDRIVDAWQGLTMNEGLVGSAIKQTVLEGIDEGLLIGETWLDGTSFEAIHESLVDVSGSKEEQGLTAEILRLALLEPTEETQALRIEAKGGTEARETGCLRVMAGVTCGDILNALWETHGEKSLAYVGLEGEDAHAIWEDQLNTPKAYGKFLKGLDQAKALAQQKSRFPSMEEAGVATNMITSFIVKGLTTGMGGVERLATARHNSVDEAAAAWAWLMAVGRSRGQEWHFDNNARDRGGAWSQATTALNEIGQELLNAEADDVSGLQEKWNIALSTLRATTGE